LFSSRFTNGRSRTPRTRVKIAALAPMPSASVKTTVIVSPLAPASERRAYFTSRQKTPTASRKSNCSALIPFMTVPPLPRLRHSNVVRHRTFSTAGPKKSGTHGVAFRNHTPCRLPMFHSPSKLRGNYERSNNCFAPLHEDRGDKPPSGNGGADPLVLGSPLGT